jgi:hypothetical protein
MVCGLMHHYAAFCGSMSKETASGSGRIIPLGFRAFAHVDRNRLVTVDADG